LHDTSVEDGTAVSTVRDRTHLPLGVFSILLGLGAGYLAVGYGMGSVRDMGAGFFPVAIATLLVGLGLLVIVRGGRDLSAEERTVPAASPRERRDHLLRLVRVLATTLGGLLAFALMLQPAGMVASVIALVGIVSLGHPGPKPLPVLVLAVGLAAFSAIVFVVLLKVQIGIWPQFLSGVR